MSEGASAELAAAPAAAAEAQTAEQQQLTASAAGCQEEGARPSRVRVILRIRPLLRREYGYPLAAEKQEGGRRGRRAERAPERAG